MSFEFQFKTTETQSFGWFLNFIPYFWTKKSNIKFAIIGSSFWEHQGSRYKKTASPINGSGCY